MSAQRTNPTSTGGLPNGGRMRKELLGYIVVMQHLLRRLGTISLTPSGRYLGIAGREDKR